MVKEEADKKAICRDFLRNLCSRGDSCKYKHPPKKYIFCHDYQNGKCKRGDCMFIHCSRDDEDHYNQFGELPPHLAELPQVSQRCSEMKDYPVCKDFMKGECTRLYCKFRHINVSPIPAFRNEYESRFDYECEELPYPKRQRLYEETAMTVNAYMQAFEPLPPQQQLALPHQRVERSWSLEDENAMLRKTVAELQKRVDDLHATNEFLLEQNAQMRLSDKASAHITALTVPTVTIAPPPLPQVSAPCVAPVPVSIAAVAAATPVSLAGVSMAQGTVQMAPPSVTIAAQRDHADSGGTPTLLTSQPAPLVTYPLVGRAVMPPTLTH